MGTSEDRIAQLEEDNPQLMERMRQAAITNAGPDSPAYDPFEDIRGFLTDLDQHLQQDPSWDRGSIMPGALIAPGAIVGMARGLVGSAQTANDLFHMARGGLQPGEILPPEDTVTLATSGLGLGGAMGDAGSAAMFGGLRNLSSVERARLGQAQKALIAGVPPNEVWHEFGWGIGPEGKMKYEIPETNAGLKLDVLEPNLNTGTEWQLPQSFGDFSVGDVLEHPDLYSKYPEIAKMPLIPERNPQNKGSFDPVNKIMSVGSLTPAEMYSTLLHESQHAIQGMEGFILGGSPNEFLPAGYGRMLGKARNDTQFFTSLLGSATYEDAMSGVLKARMGLPMTGEEENAFRRAQNMGVLPTLTKHVDNINHLSNLYDKAVDDYKHVGGEIEARNVQSRAEQPEYVRRAVPFWDTQDYTTGIINPTTGERLTIRQVDHDPFASVAAQGEGGDTMLGHLTPGDAIVSKEAQANPQVQQLLQRIYQVSGRDPNRFIAGRPGNRVNPKTGLPEFDDGGSGGEGGAPGNSGGNDGPGEGGNGDTSGGNGADAGTGSDMGGEIGSAAKGAEYGGTGPGFGGGDPATGGSMAADTGVAGTIGKALSSIGIDVGYQPGTTTPDIANTNVDLGELGKAVLGFGINALAGMTPAGLFVDAVNFGQKAMGQPSIGAQIANGLLGNTTATAAPATAAPAAALAAMAANGMGSMFGTGLGGWTGYGSMFDNALFDRGK